MPLNNKKSAGRPRKTEEQKRAHKQEYNRKYQEKLRARATNNDIEEYPSLEPLVAVQLSSPPLPPIVESAVDPQPLLPQPLVTNPLPLLNNPLPPVQPLVEAEPSINHAALEIDYGWQDADNSRNAFVAYIYPNEDGFKDNRAAEQRKLEEEDLYNVSDEEPSQNTQVQNAFSALTIEDDNRQSPYNTPIHEENKDTELDALTIQLQVQSLEHSEERNLEQPVSVLQSSLSQGPILPIVQPTLEVNPFPYHTWFNEIRAGLHNKPPPARRPQLLQQVDLSNTTPNLESTDTAPISAALIPVVLIEPAESAPLTPILSIVTDLPSRSTLPLEDTPIVVREATVLKEVDNESTAELLLKQLLSFQGCSDITHQEHDNHHASENHPGQPCSSFSDLLERQEPQPNNLIPDVLSEPGMAGLQNVTSEVLQQLYESQGEPAPIASPRSAELVKVTPSHLCLSHQVLENQNQQANITFDVDSLCLFPTSLAVAQQGIFWQPIPYTMMNFNADIHFSRTIDAYNARGQLVNELTPLHKIPHCCIGEASGFEGLLLYAFFPKMALQPARTTNFLTETQLGDWVDGLFLPALYTEHHSEDGLVQHFPASYSSAKFDATAHSTEQSMLVKDKLSLARQLRIRHFIQPEKLNGIWTRILATVATNPQYSDFKDMFLFACAKDTKSRWMSKSLPRMIAKWDRHYGYTIDPEFQSRDKSFLDLGKQVTAIGSHLLGEPIPADKEPQSFLYKRCCLESFFKWFNRHALQQPRQRQPGEEGNNKPIRQMFSVALSRDYANMTIAFPKGSRNARNGHIYSQFYSEAQLPFRAAKLYPFTTQGLESMAADPDFLKTLQYQGGSTVFDIEAAIGAYLHAKERTHLNTIVAQYKSYGIREEHRISLELWDSIRDRLIEQMQVGAPVNCSYYTLVPSRTLFGFLRSQVNKYCLGFEHLYAQSSIQTYVPWDQRQLMVYFLRMLRLCYGADQLGREKEVYKDVWRELDDHGDLRREREGLGLQETIARYGIGWFMPKIEWSTWNIRDVHARKMISNAPYIQQSYQRRWQSVKGTVDAYVILNDASDWATKFNIRSGGPCRRKWLDYLLVVNLQEFRASICHQIHDSIHPRHRPKALLGSIPFCYNSLSDVLHGPPHLVNGNRMRYKSGPAKLVDFLFDYDDVLERGAWDKLSYRLLYRNTIGLVQRVCGGKGADAWISDLKALILMTNWLLPYPCKATIFDRTKPANGLPSQHMWFSSHSDAIERNDISRVRSDTTASLEYLLMRARRLYTSWETGRGDYIRHWPLQPDMMHDIEGLSYQARLEYFTDLMPEVVEISD